MSSSDELLDKQKHFQFRALGVLITGLGCPFKEEFFDKVLHEYVAHRRCAMGVTEQHGDKVHFHMVVACNRSFLWHSANLKEQLGMSVNIKPLRHPEDVVTAMAYITKYVNPSVWAIKTSTAKAYKDAVLKRIQLKLAEAHGEEARNHYANQYNRVARHFFPPEDISFLPQ